MNNSSASIENCLKSHLASFKSSYKNVCKSYFKVSGKKTNTELFNLVSIQSIVINKKEENT